jgi:phosphate transport system protein
MLEIDRTELAVVNADLILMTQLVGKAITDATTALLTGDLALAQQVIGGDDQLDELNVKIEDECFQITSTQAPVARKLRMVMSAVRMATSLERMGDLAVHIARKPHYSFIYSKFSAPSSKIFGLFI